MKVRAVLEFDLEDLDGSPITKRREFTWAADATHDAIRARLMGEGFLPAEMMIGTYNLDVDVVEGEISISTLSGGVVIEPRPKDA